MECINLMQCCRSRKKPESGLTWSRNQYHHPKSKLHFYIIQLFNKPSELHGVIIATFIFTYWTVKPRKQAPCWKSSKCAYRVKLNSPILLILYSVPWTTLLLQYTDGVGLHGMFQLPCTCSTHVMCNMTDVVCNMRHLQHGGWWRESVCKQSICSICS